jgi:hypothetical protein
MNHSESEIFNNIMEKLEEIMTTIRKIHDYSVEFDNNKTIQYLEKLKEFSLGLNNLHSISVDLYEEYIAQTETQLLSKEDANNQKNILINKKIQNIFLPYMLYLQILMTNTPNN